MHKRYLYSPLGCYHLDTQGHASVKYEPKYRTFAHYCVKFLAMIIGIKKSCNSKYLLKFWYLKYVWTVMQHDLAVTWHGLLIIYHMWYNVSPLYLLEVATVVCVTQSNFVTVIMGTNEGTQFLCLTLASEDGAVGVVKCVVRMRA